MLLNQTKQSLLELRLTGMARAYEHQATSPQIQSMAFDDRFAALVDAERNARENSRLARLLKAARLRTQACPEDIDYRVSRGLDKGQVQSLLACDWVARAQNVIVTGPTGVGKTWLACALGNQAARRGLPVLYRRVPRLLEELEIAHADGSLSKVRSQLARAKLLILDDWGIAPLSSIGRQDLLEVIDDRVNVTSVIITAQLPVEKWHAYIGDPTIADAILDRVVHSAHRITLKGESMRKSRAAGAEG